MERTVSVVSSVSGIVGVDLWSIGAAVTTHVQNFGDNPTRNHDLLNRAHRLGKEIASDDNVVAAAHERVNQELPILIKSLQQFNNQRHPLTLKSHEEHSALDKAEKLLKSLEDEVQLERQRHALQLFPRVYNEIAELPSPKDGLDRVKPILNFLEASNSQDLRVIAIHGLPGLGKTTLLHYLFNEVSAKKPFTAQAYVQIGDDASPQTICALQTSIFRQLEGGNAEFPDDSFGRSKLEMHFQSLKSHNKSVFLAIDNVFETKHLESLLPRKFESKIPKDSCLIITCRDFGMVKALLHFCNLKEDDRTNVFHYNPRCLGRQEAQRVFAKCAGIEHSTSEHQELLDAMVPLCGGLPLALTVLGGVFKYEDERKDWQNIKKQWSTLADPEGEVIRKALQVSYGRLTKKCKIAYLDMVSTFYGWCWERVERIVDKRVMSALKNSSLISEVDGIHQCNQSAMRVGCYFPCSCRPCSRRVSMHDLILRFGESILSCEAYGSTSQDAFGNYKHFVKEQLISQPISSLRNLVSSKSSHDRDSLEHAAVNLKHAGNLQMLALLSPKNLSNWYKFPAGFRQSTYCYEQSQLRFLLLDGIWTPCTLYMVFEGLRDLVLTRCDDLVQLPNAPFHFLEVLQIFQCPEFEGFSESCVKEWHSLRCLKLGFCPNIRRIPQELCSIPSLETITISGCARLEELPSLNYSPQEFCSNIVEEGCARLQAPFNCQLRYLSIEHLPNLKNMFEQASMPELRDLRVSHCNALLKLPGDMIANASSLESLDLMDCESLVELLPDGTEIVNLTSLTQLRVSHCPSLKELPAGIFLNARPLLSKVDVTDNPGLVTMPAQLGTVTSLMELSLNRCENLVALPKEMGDLHSLKLFTLSGCAKLEKLPQQIGKLTSLIKFSLEGCENLVALPQQIGKLTSLIKFSLEGCVNLVALPPEIGDLFSLVKLDLTGCSKLEMLPNSIGSMTSLKKLSLHGCESLAELPEEMGYLYTLMHLNLSGCKKLRKVPDSFASMTSLQKLNLSECTKLEKLPDAVEKMRNLEELDLEHCESLKEVPQQIGGLSSLLKLRLGGCIKLEKLPDFIEKTRNLEELDLWDCESLMEVPQLIEGLSSLVTLKLSGCIKLEKLPDTIEKMRNLEEFDLWDCESLKEVPQQIGGLSSLVKLRLSGCKKLEKLPDSIDKLRNLEELDLSRCENLKEVPQQICMLSSLKILNLSDCKKMLALPQLLGRLTSLMILDLAWCENLVTLPQEMGGLHHLISLDLRGCKKLERLPDSIASIKYLVRLDLEGCETLSEVSQPLLELSRRSATHQIISPSSSSQIEATWMQKARKAFGLLKI